MWGMWEKHLFTKLFCCCKGRRDMATLLTLDSHPLRHPCWYVLPLATAGVAWRPSPTAQDPFLLSCWWPQGAFGSLLSLCCTNTNLKGKGVSPLGRLWPMNHGNQWIKLPETSTAPESPQPDWAPVATVVARSIAHSWIGYSSLPLSLFPWTFFQSWSLEYLSKINCLSQSPISVFQLTPAKTRHR